MKAQTGNPKENGVYACFVKDEIWPAKRMFLTWDKRHQKWCYPSSDQFYRDEVLGWIGPLEPIRKFIERWRGEYEEGQTCC